ncbi:MAG: 2-dehydropantoate 2-reductase [Planctomycetota bacterium]|nr:MAG: 2-dehydropantoate 2-reductase [Planctomycetota bacterium]
MRVGIVGTGAIGCLLGGVLKEGGLDTVLIGRNEQTVGAINGAGGVRIDDEDGSRLVQLKATLDHRCVEQTDLAILAVKAYDTREALRGIAPFLKPETALLTLQNGLGNVEAADEILGTGRILAGTTSHGANVLAPGHIRHAGVGDTLVGEPSGGISARVVEVARSLTAAGFNCEAVENVVGCIWLKTLINAAINPLTALLCVRNGVLAEDRALKGIMRTVVEEGIAVAQAAEVCLPCDDPYAKVLEVCKATGENISSMLQDVLHGRRTEIDQINGALAVRAARAGIEAPFNALLHALVKALGAAARRAAPM